MSPSTDLLAPKRTAALVVRGHLPNIERFQAEIGQLAAREDLLVVYVKVSPGKLMIVGEPELRP